MFPLVALITISGTVALTLGAPLRAETWTMEFPIDKQGLASPGRNPHFILEPGRYLVLREGNVKLNITVSTETKMVDGVQARVIEERESRAGSGRKFRGTIWRSASGISACSTSEKTWTSTKVARS